MKKLYKLLFTVAIIFNCLHLHAQINFTDSGQKLGSFMSMAFGDVNGDGFADIFTVGNPNKIWINNGTGTFNASSQAIGSGAYAVALADLDGDGDLDAFIGKEGPCEVWTNDGNGNFTNSGQKLGNKRGSGVGLADLDGDGDIDAFVSNLTKYINGKNVEGENQVWLNDGKGNFTLGGQVFINGEHTSVHLGDIDKDGNMDAVVTSNQGYPDQGIPNENEIWINDGKAHFTKKVLSTPVSGDLALGDLDIDGDLDILITYSDTAMNNGAKIFLNDGKGNFTVSGQNFKSTPGWYVCLGDLDKDGDLDAIITIGTAYNKPLPTEVWINDGNGNYTRNTANFGNNKDIEVNLADLNNDGYPDPVIGNKIWFNTTGSTGIVNSYEENKISVFPNPTTGLFTISFGTMPVQRANVEIFNFQGKLVLSKTFQCTSYATYDISAFPAGIYVIKAAADHESQVWKISKD